MPKGGKRKGGTPEHEVIEAYHRIRKHREYLKASRDSDDWQEFLANIGVHNPEEPFWERVREKARPKRQTISDIEHYQSLGIRYDILQYRSGRISPVYRDSRGRFVSVKNL